MAEHKGRSYFLWALILGIIVSWLVFYTLPPNRTARVNYAEPARVNYVDWEIPIDAHYLQDKKSLEPLPGEDRGTLDVWMKWLAESANQNKDYRVIWLEQKQGFSRPYNSFTSEVMCDPAYEIKSKVAFLMHRDGASARPIYRQLDFLTDHKGGSSRKFELVRPEKGERLILIARVFLNPKHENASFPTATKYYDFKVRSTASFEDLSDPRF